MKLSQRLRRVFRGTRTHKSDSRKDLLCAQSEWRHCRYRTTEKRYEFASPHSQPQGSEQGIVAGQTGRLEVDKTALGDVRFGSKADIAPSPTNVRFTPKSGHCIAPQRMSAMCQKRTIVRCGERRRYSITSSAVASSDSGTVN